MRLHVICHGKKTTISLDDQLVDYLGAWLVEHHPKWHGNAKKQHEMATAHIRRYIEVAAKADVLPPTNLSQHVQAYIIESIAAPCIAPILKVRGPRHKSEPDRQSSPEDVELAMEAMTAILGKKRPATA